MFSVKQYLKQAISQDPSDNYNRLLIILLIIKLLTCYLLDIYEGNISLFPSVIGVDYARTREVDA